MQIAMLKENLKAYGLPATVAMYGFRGARKIAGVRALRGVVLESPAPSLTSLEAPYRARFLDQRELERLANEASEEYDLLPSFVRSATQRGDSCFGVFDQDRLAAYGWYSYQPVRIDDENELCFDSAYVYMYAGFTLPAHRGRRLHALGMGLACMHFRAQGRRGLISYVDAANLNSWRSCLRLGYRHIGNIYRLSVGHRSLAWSDVGCRQYGFRLRPARAPIGGPRANRLARPEQG